MTVVVVFSSRRTPDDEVEYAELAARMDELVAEQTGFVSLTSVRDPVSRRGITVGYFTDAEAVRAWCEQAEHAHARERGRQSFYEEYRVTVATVDRDYAWTAPDHG